MQKLFDTVYTIAVPLMAVNRLAFPAAKTACFSLAMSPSLHARAALMASLSTKFEPRPRLTLFCQRATRPPLISAAV